VIVWVTALHATVSALNNLVIALLAATTALKAKVSAHHVNSTTVAHATMDHVHPATLMRHAHLAVTTMTSNLVPMRTWAPKVA
jgi:hypothetical protein